ncbi:MAG: hypothetical protein WA949_14400 [Phormidesmis sp.]
MERVSDKLDSRLEDGWNTPGQLDSIAYQIHNLYSSVEDLLKLIASAFENNIGSDGGWHRTLLLRMSQPMEGIRPAFLSEESFDLMDRLRTFRHMFRHAYGADIDRDQLQGNLATAQKLYDSIAQDIDSFLQQLAESEDSNNS